VLRLLTDGVHWVQDRPWLAGLALALLAAGYLARGLLHSWRHHRLAEHAHYVAITPPPEVDEHGAAAWWANVAELLTPSARRRLLYGTAHIAVEFRWAGRELTIGVWVPGTIPASPIVSAARAAWPGAAATITPVTPPIPAGALTVGGALAPKLPGWYPLESDHDADPLRPLVAAAANLHRGEHACVQILARPATPRQIIRLRRGAAALRTGRPSSGPLDPATWLRGALDFVTPGPSATAARSRTAFPADPLRERDGRAAIDKTLPVQWEVAIRYAAAHTNPNLVPEENLRARVVTTAHAIASAFGAYTARNRLRRLRMPQPAATLARRSMRRGFLLSAPELAAMAALPRDVAVAGLDRARAKAVPAPIAVPAGGRDTKSLGRAEVGGHGVALNVADARQHIHLLGSTGSGKSTLMTHMILDDIHAHRGVVLIDPKGDLALDVLDRLPASMAGRIVLIDPDQEGGATFNPLAGADHDLVVDNIVSIFSAIFQRHWGPRIDDVLRVACLTALRHTGENATLTMVPPLLNSKQFRAPYTVGLTDPEGLHGFWQWYESTPPALRAQLIGPVLSRLRAFLLRDFVRRTMGPAKSSFDMGKILDGGILIARLPKGQIGEDTAKLMGSFLFSSVWQAATARARMPEHRRREASVYIDEAHNVLNLAGSVGDMLAEARGYHLSLVLAHQNLTQLPRDTQLALSANARNKIFFSCSPEDAKQLARHTLPELDEHDLSHLNAYTAAARLVVGSRETASFTLRTKPPKEPLGETAAIRGHIAQAHAARVQHDLAADPDGDSGQDEDGQDEDGQDEDGQDLAGQSAASTEAVETGGEAPADPAPGQPTPTTHEAEAVPSQSGGLAADITGD
jgi:energy-coupling factor transporter ATP-binding protein EcfA2